MLRNTVVTEGMRLTVESVRLTVNFSTEFSATFSVDMEMFTQCCRVSDENSRTPAVYV